MQQLDADFGWIPIVGFFLYLVKGAAKIRSNWVRAAPREFLRLLCRKPQVCARTASLESISSDFQRFLPKACLQATLSPPSSSKNNGFSEPLGMENSGKRGRQWMCPDVPKLNLQRITLEGCRIESCKQILHSVTPSTVSVNVHVDHEVHSSSTFCFRHCLPLLVEE